MARFNAAKMWGALDTKFQSVYNQLIDLLDTGYVTELTIDSKKVRVEISPKVGIEITVDGVKVFGVSSTGRIFAQSISNLDDGTWYAEMGYGADSGLSLYNGTPIRFCNITSDVSDDIVVFDKNTKQRITVAPDGSITIYDAASTQELVLWCDFTGGFIQLHAPRKTPYKDHAIGVDQTGAYKITAGVKAYL